MSLIDDIFTAPDAEQYAFVRAEIGDEQTFARTLNEFSEWAATQDYLPINFDERLLVTYLRACCCNLPLAKRAFVNTFIAHEKLPEMYQFEFTESEQSAARNSIMVSTPRLTSQGLRVVFMSLYAPNADFNMLVSSRKAIQRGTFRSREEPTNAGDIIFVDMRNVPYYRAMRTMMQQRAKLLQGQFIFDNFPLHIRTICIVNATGLLVRFTHIFKWMLPDRLQKRLMFANSNEEIIRLAGAECVPSDYGGTAPSLAELDSHWTKMLETHGAWLRGEHSVRLRGTPPKKIE